MDDRLTNGLRTAEVRDDDARESDFSTSTVQRVRGRGDGGGGRWTYPDVCSISYANMMLAYPLLHFSPKILFPQGRTVL